MIAGEKPKNCARKGRILLAGIGSIAARSFGLINVGLGLALEIWLLSVFPTILCALLGVGVAGGVSRIGGIRPKAVDEHSLIYDAFICYSRKDSDFARALQKALNTYGTVNLT